MVLVELIEKFTFRG